MLRTVTIRMQDVSPGNDKASGCFRMFRKVAIRLQDATQGYNKVSQTRHCFRMFRKASNKP